MVFPQIYPIKVFQNILPLKRKYVGRTTLIPKFSKMKSSNKNIKFQTKKLTK